jgi:hypothetical protein
MEYIVTIERAKKPPGAYIASVSGRPLCTTRQPLLDAAAILLAEGADPEARIVLMRDGVVSLRGSVGYAARLTVVNDRFTRRSPGDKIDPPSEPDPDPDPSTAGFIHGIIGNGPHGSPWKMQETPSDGESTLLLAPPVDLAPSVRSEMPLIIDGPPRPLSVPRALHGHWAADYWFEPGYTYFIRAVHPIARIKIGASYTPENRIRELQTASPTPLELLKVTAGGFKMEAAWHYRFRRLRRHLEWFNQTPGLLNEIRAIPVAPDWRGRTHPDVYFGR